MCIQDRQCTYNVTFEARSCNHCWSGKAISTTYSECVCVCVCVCVALGIQHTMRMRHYCHLWPAPLYSIFPHLINGTIFEKKTLNTKRVFRFPLHLLSETLLILRRTEWNMVKKSLVVWYSWITIHKAKSNKMQQCIKILLFHIYMKLNMFWATPPIIRSLNLHWQPLVFHTWKTVGLVVGGQRPTTARPTTFHVWKTRGCHCSFRLLMMGGVSPETCWVSYKYGIIKFWYIVAYCWSFLYEMSVGLHVM
jgi:hypothetical protein